jgi:DNA-binding XRE family transcriptional regulator
MFRGKAMESETQTKPTKEFRELAGVLLKEAAETVDVAVSTMWAFEHGRPTLNLTQESLLLEFYAQRFAERGKRAMQSIRATATL